jgi:hypothetical protein
MQELRYKIFSGLVVAGLVLLTSLSVHAQDWEQSFPPQALESHLPYQATRVLVITAGQLDEDTNRLQKALISRINGIDDATAVTIPSLNGRDVDDRELLASVEKVHPDVILIIRLFNPENSRATAIGTFYGSDKKVVSAFALEEGQVMKSRTEEETSDDGRQPLPLPKKSKSEDEEEEAEEPTAKQEPEAEKQRDPSEGVSSKTAEAVSSIGEERRKKAEARRDNYEDGVIEVHSTAARVFYRGVYKEKISPQTFLREVGKPELAAQYEKRRDHKRSISALSGVMTVGGLLLLSGGAASNSEQIATAMLIAGGASGTVGFIGLLSAIAWNPFPLDASEARRLAHEHNKKLEGRPDDLSLQRPAPSLDIGAGPMGNGAGFVLKATF